MREIFSPLCKFGQLDMRITTWFCIRGGAVVQHISNRKQFQILSKNLNTKQKNERKTLLIGRFLESCLLYTGDTCCNCRRLALPCISQGKTPRNGQHAEITGNNDDSRYVQTGQAQASGSNYRIGVFLLYKMFSAFTVEFTVLLSFFFAQ